MQTTSADPLAQPFDVHIIGSGIGALTAGVILAKVFNKRVCLLEQHWTVGGQTQVFRRKGRYEWDVGLHYVGNLNGRGLSSQVSRFISGNQLRWRELDPCYDRIRFEDAELDVPTGSDAFYQMLSERFPGESAAIKRYLDDRKQISKWAMRHFAKQTVPSVFAPVMKLLNAKGRNLARITLADYLEKNFRSPRLKNLLGARYGDYGLAPQDSSFMIHALVMESYRKGAVYPEGGSSAIAEHCLRELRAHGGECLTNVRVERILTQGNRVTSLELTEHYHTPKAQKRVIPVDTVLSNAGAHNTYRKLLDTPRFAELEQLPKRASATTLYLGLKQDPAELGFTSSNYWLYPRSADGKLLNESDLFFFVSFPSLKKGLKQAQPTDGHCAEILTIGSPEQFAKWAGTSWKKRGKDYRALKQELENQLLEQVFTFYPQLRDAIDYTEVSTPLSMEFFTQHPAGNMYGVPFVPGREKFKFCQAKTPYQNLFLSGQDVITLGIEGALMGGAFGAAISQGSAGFPALLKALKQHESASTAELSSQQA